MPSPVDLPPELLDIILGYCDHASLKALRLTSESLLEYVEPLVFRELHMCFYPTSVEKAKKIADSEDLCGYVERLVLHSALLPDAPPRDFFEQFLPAQDGNRPFSRQEFCFDMHQRMHGLPGVEPWNPSNPPAEVTAHLDYLYDTCLPKRGFDGEMEFADYTKVARKQQAVACARGSKRSFRELLRDFPSLRAVDDEPWNASYFDRQKEDFSKYFFWYGFPWTKDPWPKYKPQHFAAPVDQQAGFFLDDQRIGTRYTISLSGRRAWDTSETPPLLEHLGLFIAADAWVDKYEIELYRLSKLTSLDLNVVTCQGALNAIMDDGLIDALKNAKYLERLRINITWTECQRFGSFFSFLSGMHFPNLKELEMESVSLRLFEMRRFLKNHARTLTSLTIRCSMMRGVGQWETTLKEMRTLVKLKHLRLESLVEATSPGREVSYDDVFVDPNEEGSSRNKTGRVCFLYSDCSALENYVVQGGSWPGMKGIETFCSQDLVEELEDDEDRLGDEEWE